MGLFFAPKYGNYRLQVVGFFPLREYFHIFPKFTHVIRADAINLYLKFN